MIGAESKARRVFATPMPEKALHVLQKRGRLTCAGDLNRRLDAPLIGYLNERGLNVVAPLMSVDSIVGWLAMNLDNSILTDDFLDDLHIATRLLSMSLSSPLRETSDMLILRSSATHLPAIPYKA